MADTLSLDAAVSYIIDRGGSIRLIGDDQQLAAIGAGGVLRDIQATHGAVRLTEPLRFSDPAEAAATLALRDGKAEAIGFYLDNQRIHVGDLSTITEQVFAAWQHDRSTGLDSIMLAPTRELVAQLNQRARSHRLAHTPPASNPDVALADGNRASVGDLIITRSNDRQLRLTATDWVKNGDRWIVLADYAAAAILTSNICATGTASDSPPDTYKPPPSSATPPPCTPRRDSPSTPCTASPPVRSPGSSSTPC